MRAPLPSAALRESWQLFRKRPLAASALGIALLTSLVAVCCGLGIFAAPWFLCELFAMLIASGTGIPTRRTSAWLGAALVQMAAVAVLCALAGLSLLALGPDVLMGDAGVATSTSEQVLESLGVLILAGSLAIALSVHFEHAPAILIERGGGLHAALLESARLVAETGPFRTWLTSFAAHGLQMAPAVAAVALAATHASLRGTLLWGIALLPAVAVSLVVGQGMVVASYLPLRGLVTDPAMVPAEASVSKSGTFLWSLLLGGVVAGPLLVSAALTKPAYPAVGGLPVDTHLLLDLEARRERVERYLPGTALRLRADTRSLSLAASDGGGVGTLPLPAGGLTRVRAARVHTLPATTEPRPVGSSVFAIEVSLRNGQRYTTWIDETGVRLDDSLTRRFDAVLPPWAPLALLLCLVWTALWIARALPPQARLRRELAERAAAGHELAQREQLRAALRRRALGAALWLVPPAALSLTLGSWAALR